MNLYDQKLSYEQKIVAFQLTFNITFGRNYDALTKTIAITHKSVVIR